MSEPLPLISTVAPPNIAADIALLEAEVQAAVADATVDISEVQPGIQAILKELANDGILNETSALAQLADASPDVAAFVAALQQTIFNTKAATTQGLLLKMQLDAGSITQVQFTSSVNAIVLSAGLLQAATAAIFASQTQILLLALSSNPKLLQLAKLVPKAAETGIKSSTTEAALPVTAQAKDQVNNLLETQFKDENLSFLQNLFAVAKAIALQNLKASASSLISLKPAPRIMTGARAVLRINNKVVALCNNVQYEINMDWGEIRGVDELIPNDLAPMVFSVKGSMSIYRVPNQSPIGEFIHQDMFRGMIWPYTTIEIRDKRTDELIMLVKRAAITARSEGFSKSQLTSTAMSFIGIGFRDETTPELLPDTLTGSDDGGNGLLDAFKAIGNLF